MKTLITRKNFKLLFLSCMLLIIITVNKTTADAAEVTVSLPTFDVTIVNSEGMIAIFSSHL